MTRVMSSVGIQSGFLLPKQSLSVVCAHFETFSGHQKHQQPRFDLNKRNKRPPERREFPKYCENFHLPMGAKKWMFIENDSIKPCDCRLSKPIINSLHSPKLDLELSLSQSPKLQSPEQSSVRRSAKILIPRQIKLEADVVKMTSKHSEEKKTPPKANLELISYQLTQDLTNIFMKRQEWRMYHPELVFVDNVRGSRLVGLDKYMLFINLMRMLAHVRFVYVRMTLLSVSKDEEASTVKIRWNIVGLGMARLVLRYFPDRLWEKGNMERFAPAYLDGYSTFYVNSDNQIYQHTLDRVRQEQGENTNKTLIQRLLDLIGKQARVHQPV